VSPGDAAAENQLLYKSWPPDHPDAGPAQLWDEQVPPPGRDATLLAVVPIPGTGTSLAIVGQNGAGKTTLAKLLCRLYDPQSGAIEVDGVDLRDLDLESWRRQVTAVFQDFLRLELPLRENVAPAGAPDEVVLAALESAALAIRACVGGSRNRQRACQAGSSFPLPKAPLIVETARTT